MGRFKDTDPGASPDLSLGETAADLAFAPVRGVEGAVQGVYGLADSLLGDALPDYEHRLLGESKSFAGGMLEDVVQFTAGFLPATRALKAGKLATNFLGLTGKGAQFARATVAGAAADFTVFDGQEERLSNLIENYPALSNPITELLQSNPEDSQIEGRFKAAVEGIGLGIAAEGLFTVLRGIWRRGRSIADARPSKEAAEEALRGIDGEAVEVTAKGENSYVEAFSETTIKQAQLPDNPTNGQLLDAIGLGVKDGKTAIQRITERVEERIAFELDANVNPRKLNKFELLDQELTKEAINMEHWPEGDAAQISRAIEAEILPWVKENINDPGRTTLEAIEKNAVREVQEALGHTGDFENFTQSLTEDIGEGELIPRLMARAHAMKAVINSSGEKLFKRLDDISSGKVADLTPREELEVLEMLENHSALIAKFKGLGSEAGRFLRTFGLPVRDMGVPQLKAALEQAGGQGKLRELSAQMLEAIRNGDGGLDLQALGNLTRTGYGNRLQKMTTEYWMNSILSGPTTLVTNGVTSPAFALYRPFEKMLASGFAGGPFTQAGRRQFSTAFRELTSLAGGFQEGLKLAWRNKSQLQPFSKTANDDVTGLLARREAPARPFQDGRGRQAIATDREGLAATMWNSFGNVVNLPTNILRNTDELTKQGVFRANLRSTLYEEAANRGMVGRQMDEWVLGRTSALIEDGQILSQEALLRKGFKDAREAGLHPNSAEGRAHAQRYYNTSEGLIEQSVAAAKDSTFTSDLEEETLFRGIEKFVNAHPIARFFGLTFVKTPVNLLKTAGQRMDVPGLFRIMTASVLDDKQLLAGSKSRLVRDYLSGDPRRQAEAASRITMGFGALAALGQIAMDGDEGLPTITGSGPSNPAQRKALEATGWKPYSFRMGDKYVQYQRLDPFASIAGIAADLAQVGLAAGPEYQDEVQSVGAAFALSVSQNLLNKSYARGLGEAMNAWSQGGSTLDSYLNRQAASFVPNAIAKFNQTDDSSVKEVRSMVDALKARIPGLSDELPDVRNFLGEKITRFDEDGLMNMFNPVITSKIDDDIISKEILKIGHAFGRPGAIKQGVDLTQIRVGSTNAYDKYQSLTGKVKIGGRSLRQALRSRIKSREYQNMAEQGTETLKSPRARELQKIISRYRREAWRELMRQEPSVKEADRISRSNQDALKNQNAFSPLTDF